MEALFATGQEQKIITPLDWHIALFLTKYTPLIGLQKYRFIFLILILGIWRHNGHVCLSLHMFDSVRQNKRSLPAWIMDCWHALGKPGYHDWVEVLHASTLLTGEMGKAPLVLMQDRLYFQRLWDDERTVANYFLAAAKQRLFVPAAAERILNILFNGDDETINWQKTAVAMSLSRSVTLISGGPGTGKTTTAAKILLAHVLLSSSRDNPLRIKAAAPTGKAAARLTISLKNALSAMPSALDREELFPEEAITLHRLLGAGKKKRPFMYDKNHPLAVDILIVDEASMIDLSMMAAIVHALPKQAKLILLGDKEQLSSVEAGAVLGDLCQLFHGKYSKERAEELKLLIHRQLPATPGVLPMADTICFLQESHRFSAHSGIGLLARDIKEGVSDIAIHRLRSKSYADIEFQPLTVNDYDSFIESIARKYGHYFDVLNTTQNIQHALLAWDDFRLLAAMRNGKYGVLGLNQAIERVLCKRDKIQKTVEESSYLGRPVMILKNDPKLKLWNGDIGITWQDPEDPKQHRVYFQLTDGTLRSFSPLLLPEHETAFVMTVHKAQGSEFSQVALILPPESNAILTRALLYTAVTRAKQKITIYGQTTILHHTIQTQNERDSGLYERLNSTESVLI